MRPLTVCLAAAVLAGPVAAQDAKPYESTELKFKIQLPSTPKSEKKTETVNNKTLTFNLTTWESEKREKAIVISVVDYVVGAGETFDPAKALDAGVTAVAGKSTVDQAKVEKLDKWKDETLPGRRFLAKQADKPVWSRNLMLVKGTRLYHIVVAGPEDYATNESGKILDSFEIAK